MKISAEGYEFEILKGSKVFLQKFNIPFLIVEIDLQHMSRVSYSWEDLNNILFDLRYVARRDGFKGKVVSLLDESTRKELGMHFHLYL